MTIKPIVIGGVTVPNNVFFAPLAGFSTAEMRHAAYKAGAGLCFTEMVSAKGLMYAPDASKDLLVNLDENKVFVTQTKKVYKLKDITSGNLNLLFEDTNI